MNNKKSSKKYVAFIKLLTFLSCVLMLVAVVLCAVFMIKNNITVSNMDTVAQYFTGGTLTLIALMVGLNVLKSFTLIFPPAVLYVLSGLVFDDFLTAVAINLLASACSLILPYYLGKLTGIEAVNYLKQRFSSVRKLDDFTGSNSFAVVFIVKVGLIPSDLSSLIFGAMGIPFGKYFLSSNLACFVLNILWTLLGAKGELSNPLSWLYALPAIVFALVASFALAFYVKKKKNKNGTEM